MAYVAFKCSRCGRFVTALHFASVIVTDADVINAAKRCLNVKMTELKESQQWETVENHTAELEKTKKQLGNYTICIIYCCFAPVFVP